VIPLAQERVIVDADSTVGNVLEILVPTIVWLFRGRAVFSGLKGR
jgi:hypothetical protein